MLKILVFILSLYSLNIHSAGKIKDDIDDHYLPKVFGIGLIAHYYINATKKSCKENRRLYIELEKIKKQLAGAPELTNKQVIQLSKSRELPILAKFTNHYLKALKEEVSLKKLDEYNDMKERLYFIKLINPKIMHFLDQYLKDSNGSQDSIGATTKATKNYKRCILSAETSIIFKIKNNFEEFAYTTIGDQLESENFKTTKSQFVSQYLKRCDKNAQSMNAFEIDAYKTIRDICSKKDNKTIYEFDESICKTKYTYLCKIKNMINNKI